MKLFDSVNILCDWTFTEDASALRSVLEAFRLRMNYVRLVQQPQIMQFFADPPKAAYTVLMCHGDGQGDDMHLRLEVAVQEDGDYSSTEGWSVKPFKLGLSTIPEVLVNPSGTLLSTACGSGRQPLAKAFLDAGYEAFIGPQEEYWNSSSALTYTVSFFYHLLSEDRDFETMHYSARQAAERAALTDPEFKFGTRTMRYYDASDFR